jgi:SAM-dependent methyltransferase
LNCNVCGAQVELDRAPAVRKDGFDLVRCGSCGLLFRRTLPQPDEIEALYSDDYFNDREGLTGGYADYLGDERLHCSVGARRLARLEALTTGRTLLDVGAAAGFFVSEARSRGWEASGVDISRPMVRFANEALGVPVQLGGLSAVGGVTFDVVTMWDYIEHSVDPAGDVTRCAALLRPNGLIALSTGDVDSVVARISGRRWHLLTPRHHNFFFGESTVRRLLEGQGFDVLSVSHPGATYSLSHLVHKLGGMRPGRVSANVVGRLDGSVVGRLAIPVNLFDIVTVIARKGTR